MKSTGVRCYIYILGSSILIAMLAAGCMFPNRTLPEQNVQVSTVGNPNMNDLNNYQQEVVSLSEKTNGGEQKDNMVDTAPVEQDNPYGIDPTKPMIALTFDDGPSKYTWDIVKTLQQYGARGTFFVLGNRVASHEAAIDYTLVNHNEIGSHSVAHKNLMKLTDTEVRNQIIPVDESLEKQHGYMPALFRVPYGSKDERVLNLLKEVGKPVIGWSVDPYDWKVRDRETVVNHILDRVQDGDIVLLHDIYEPTALAVADLVPILQERGYQLVTVSELLQFRGITPQAGEYYRSVPPEADETTK